MAKFVADSVLDAALDQIALADRVILCEGQPADYTDATTLKSGGGHKLAEVATSGGDWTKANGDTSGRKITLGAKTGITADESGTWDHLAAVDDGTSVLLGVTTMVESVAVTAANDYDIAAVDFLELRDPT